MTLHLIESVTKESRKTSYGVTFWGVKIDGKWYNCRQQLVWKSNVEGEFKELKDAPWKERNWFEVTSGSYMEAQKPAPTGFSPKSEALLFDVFRVLCEIKEVLVNLKPAVINNPEPQEKPEGISTENSAPDNKVDPDIGF